MLRLKQTRYFIAGCWNTLFGYLSALIVYNFYHNLLHILLIGILINILNVTMSFFIYKFFVFKTKKNWFQEYLRSYITYGGVALMSLCILWFNVDYLKIPFWLAQGLVTFLGFLFSYIGHDRFTFKVK
jgi:putative flippase GtrA